MQLNLLNVHDRYLKLIVSDIFKFQNDQCPDYFDEIFCPVGKNGVTTRSSNKKLKLPFWIAKLGIQILSYVGLNTWNSLLDNLQSATSINSFKHNIQEYFLKKVSNAEADIYSHTLGDTKTKFATFLEFMHIRMGTVFYLFLGLNIKIAPNAFNFSSAWLLVY